MTKFYDKVLGIRISKEQKERLEAIAKLSGEKPARLVRDCIECFISNENCQARKRYKKLQKVV
jgi:predicted DNA-binding protein